MAKSIRVLVVDDSAFNRRTIIKMLESVPGVEIVGYASDGEEGLRKFIDLAPDLITLDLEMPKMDGFSFLRVVMQYRPTPVIVVSARSDDDNVFKALEFGAVEFVAKPSARVSPQLVSIKDDLVQKVLEVSKTDMSKVLRRSTYTDVLRPKVASRHSPPKRSASLDTNTLHMIAIASSTGGPPAIQSILKAIKESPKAVVTISQHMPPGFTKAFADRLNKFCSLEICEARSGEELLPGKVFICPGGKNLNFKVIDNKVVTDVVTPLPRHRYVPNADSMFISASEIFKFRMLAVVLTGMGNDGAQGVITVNKNGGKVFAESEDSSVVFGMPKEAIATGKVDKILPLREIGLEIQDYCLTI